MNTIEDERNKKMNVEISKRKAIYKVNISSLGKSKAKEFQNTVRLFEGFVGGNGFGTQAAYIEFEIKCDEDYEIIRERLEGAVLSIK